MSDQFNLEEETAAPLEPVAPKPTRRRQKSSEELLFEAQARAEALLAKVLEHRDRQRMQLVQELYEHHDIAGTKTDMSESERIARLRTKLGLSV